MERKRVLRKIRLPFLSIMSQIQRHLAVYTLNARFRFVDAYTSFNIASA